MGVTFTYTSPDGEEGYPGNLNLEVGTTTSMSCHLEGIVWSIDSSPFYPLMTSPPGFYQVTYSLTLSNHLDMDFKAESDAPTPVALTNHAYWNLSGDFKSKVTSHTLRVQANRYVVLGEHMVCT